MALPDIISPDKREQEQSWYISFLKEKEKTLISQLKCKRIKTQKKVFFCEEGRIEYMFTYVKLEEGAVICPLRGYLGLGQYQSMCQDFKNKLVMKASRTTYQKAVEDIRDSFGFTLAKKTLNRYVLKEAGPLEITQEPRDSEKILIADSTKVRDGHGGHHEVTGVMSLDYENNTSSLLASKVNIPSRDIADNIDLSQFVVFVGDADLGLRNFYKDKLEFQLCHQHAITDVSFFLWKEGMKKSEREPIMKRYKAILYTLQNSTKKYWRDNKTRRLVNRIIKTRKSLNSLAAELSTKGRFEGSRYIMEHKEHMITAAKLALIGIKVPWTTNHAERLMQEVGVRTKKKGMNWTERGLRAILNLVLKRYFLPAEQRTYKEIMAFKAKKVVEI